MAYTPLDKQGQFLLARIVELEMHINAPNHSFDMINSTILELREHIEYLEERIEELEEGG